MVKLLDMNYLTTTITTFLIVFLVVLSGKSGILTANECYEKPPKVDVEAVKFVLVHGFNSGAWSWYKVVTTLESLGYNVTALDLTGAGIDPTDPDTISSFDQYNHPLHHFMRRLSKDEKEILAGHRVGGVSVTKVILVGHSAGGVSVTKVIHDFPHSIQLAIYVAATMLKFGYATLEDLIIGVPMFNTSKLKCNYTSHGQLPKPECFDKVLPPNPLHSPASLEDFTLGNMLARPGPYRAVLTSKLKETESQEVDSVPRVYIKTTLDKTLKPKQQDAMISRWPPSQLHEFRADHDLIFTEPLTLGALLINVTSSMLRPSQA